MGSGQKAETDRARRERRLQAQQARADILANAIGRSADRFHWRTSEESVMKRRMAYAYWAETDRIRPDHFPQLSDD